MFLSTLPLNAQSFDQRLHTAYNEVLSLKLKQARSIKNLSFPSPDDKAFQVYILSLSDAIELLLVKNESFYETYRSRQKDYLNTINDLSDHSVFIEFVNTEVKVHGSLVRINYGDQISGALKLIRSYKSINKYDSAFYNSNPYLLKTAGLLNIILDLFPDQYNWILNMFQVKPDIKTGFKQLELLSQTNSIFNFEGMMLYALSESFFGKEKSKGYNLLNNNYINHYNNLLYNYLYGIVSIKTQNNETAIESFDTCIKFKGNFLNIPLINYYRAESYLKKQNYKKASFLYSFYLDRPNGEEFIKDSYYNLYHISLLRNDSIKASFNREMVLKLGNLNAGADKYAYNRILNSYSPNLELYESRLLFDGGYYQQSLKVLNSMDSAKLSLLQHQAEYYYRLARNYHELNQNDIAIKYYTQVVDNENIRKYYFWANSWIQLGQIFRSVGKNQKAESCYRQALSYKGKDYRNSIISEAKAALKELN